MLRIRLPYEFDRMRYALPARQVFDWPDRSIYLTSGVQYLRFLDWKHLDRAGHHRVGRQIGLGTNGAALDISQIAGTHTTQDLDPSFRTSARGDHTSFRRAPVRSDGKVPRDNGQSLGSPRSRPVGSVSQTRPSPTPRLDTTGWGHPVRWNISQWSMRSGRLASAAAYAFL